MDKVAHNALPHFVKSFIEDLVFALFLKLGNWLEAKIPSRAARVVVGFVLAVTAIVSVVTATALAALFVARLAA